LTPYLDDYRWLISQAAEQFLSTGGDDPLRLLSRLRKELSAERAHLVAEQIDLRRRARDKFHLADRMFFTRKGLEQATDEQLAAYKANRFPEGESISDLCCGIGGDLLAFANRGPTLGVDRDEIVALLATANAAAQGFTHERCLVTPSEIAEIDLGTSSWHCDPDRRPTGHRATRGELFEPTLESLASLLEKNPHAAIKLAPATDLSVEWCDRAEREWLESRGECRQQVAWFGNLARHPGHRAATVLLPDGRMRTIIGSDDHLPPIAPQIGRYLYEPASAILAAKLTTELCREHNFAAINSGVAYLTSDDAIDDLALAAFEVLDILPFDRKQLRAYCRERSIGRLEIKKRGVEVDPERLRKEIAADGDNAATLLIAPHEQKTRVFITCRRAHCSTRSS
jgi:hypothetical protein